ncbi:Ttll6a [Symbiodinium sp. CCMP2592]|nr:Ttll6a [Symbiodinium sp. CCMP2592]
MFTISTRPRKKGGHVQFNASHSDYEVVAQAAEERGWRVVKCEEKAAMCNIHWIDDANIGDWMRKVEPWMRINHFPGMNNALARKTRLARNMTRMQRLFPAAYRFVPPTWVIPDDLTDLEKRFGNSQESKVFYIVKPDHLCQGRGIFLTTELDRLRQAAEESRKKNEATVVQRYLSRPMLIEGLKFDLRLYFLVSAKKASGEAGLDMRCFLFRDGLVRLCTTPYQPPTAETMNEKCMHLTNYAVNKNSSNFQQNDGEDDGAGSKRSLRWFMSYIGETYGEKERRKLWLKLMGVCMKTVLMVKPTLETEYDGAFPRDLTGGQMGCRCFELLGIDVMLDAKMKPYLIEVNHLPSFTCDSPLDEDIKRRLVSQTLDLTCGSLSGKDRKLYEQLVRERREAGQPGNATPCPDAKSEARHCGIAVSCVPCRKSVSTLMQI